MNTLLKFIVLLAMAPCVVILTFAMVAVAAPVGAILLFLVWALDVLDGGGDCVTIKEELSDESDNI